MCYISDMYNSKVSSFDPIVKVVRTPTYVACAEMRKSTVDHLDVMVDSCGIVQESQSNLPSVPIFRVVYPFFTTSTCLPVFKKIYPFWRLGFQKKLHFF